MTRRQQGEVRRVAAEHLLRNRLLLEGSRWVRWGQVHTLTRPCAVTREAKGGSMLLLRRPYQTI